MDNVHTRPTQPSIQCVTSTLSLGVVRAECEADHVSAEVKNEWSQTSTSQQQRNFIFYLQLSSSRGGVLGVRTKLRAEYPAKVVRFSEKVRGLLLLKSAHTGPLPRTQASCILGNGTLSPVKRPWREADWSTHLAPRLSTAPPPLPHIPSWRAQEQLYRYCHFDPKHFAIKQTLTPHSSVRVANHISSQLKTRSTNNTSKDSAIETRSICEVQHRDSDGRGGVFVPIP
jgi:hypothetical protein